MKQIYRLIIGIILLGCVTSHVQAQTGSTYTGEADRQLQNVSKTQATTGVLYDRVLPFARLDLFGQTQPDTADMEYYIQAYSELRRASLTTSTLKSSKGLDYRIKELQDAGITPIGIIAYKFNLIDTLALQDGLLYQTNGLYYDKSPRSRSPFKQKTMVLAAALTETVKAGTTVHFQITSDLAVENLTANISSIAVDAGHGLVTYTVGQQFNHVFSSTGERTIKYVVRLSNGDSYTTYSVINVVANPSACSVCLVAAAIESCKPTETFYTNDDEKFQGYDESTPIPGVGEVGYYYAKCSSQTVRKPIIIMDGFDPGDGSKITDLVNDELSYKNANGDDANFLNDLRVEGYDVIVLNFPANKFLNQTDKPMHAGADYIERNALVLIHLIKQVNAELARNGSTEKLTVVGPSMGGLISRYALTYMEKKQRENPTKPEWDHRTKLWISFDTPHLGANIPVGDQYFLKFYADNGNTGAEKGRQKLDTPAAQQMLVHHYSTYSRLPKAHARRQRFLNDMNNLNPATSGFPGKVPRTVAVANGSQKGILVNSPGQKAFTMDVVMSRSKFYRFFLWSLPAFITLASSKVYFTPGAGSTGEVFRGTFPPIPFRNSDVYDIQYAQSPSYSSGYDTAPGGTYDTQKQLSDQSQPKRWFGRTFKIKNAKFYSLVENHSFIPTVSALAYTKTNQNLAENLSNRNLACTGEIPFDAYYAPANNEEHVDLTAANVTYITNEIKGTPTPVDCDYRPLLVSISGPTQVPPCVGGEWNANVSGGNGTYTYEWYLNNNISGGSKSSIAVNTYNSSDEYVEIKLVVKSGGEQATAWIGVDFDGCPNFQAGSYAVYPNPASDEFTVEETVNGQADGLATEKKEDFDIELYNEFSQVVRTKKSKNGAIKVDTKALPKGIYFLHVKDSKGIIRKKIIINHET